MARKRKELTFESNLDKVIEKIEAKPYKVMNIFGQQLVREIKSTTLKSQFNRSEIMYRKTIGYWARNREKDLQIGFKLSIMPGLVGKIIRGETPDPLKSVVVKNAELMQELLGKALDEIRKE